MGRIPRLLLLLCLASLLLSGREPARAVASRVRPDPRFLQDLAAREYWASEISGRLKAPNRQQRLRTWFESSGIRVQDRTAPGDAALVELRLASIGRGACAQGLAPGRVSSRGDRVEIRREGSVEWFVNSPEGLEHGVDLARRPAPMASGELRLELQVLGARARTHAGGVRLASAKGRELHYGELVVSDARGRAISARLEVPSHDRIAMLVDDRAALYPLRIDPLLSSTSDAQLEADQAAARLGASVAAAGDVDGDGFEDLLVGAPRFDAGQGDEGAVFLFYGSPGAIASGTLPVRIASETPGAQLGASVAGAGDVNGDGYSDFAIGAPEHSGSGAAFVFHGAAARLADSSTAAADAQLVSDRAGAQLGASVAAAGDVDGDGFGDLAIGAPLYADGQPGEGALLVLRGSPAGIASGNPTSAHALLQSDQIDAQLGASVAGAGDVNADGFDDVIAGAPLFDAGQTDEGAAFVFLGSPVGLAVGNLAAASAVLQSDLAGARLGASVAAAGDVDGDGFADAIAGAPLFAAGQAQEGAAFVFRGSAAGIASGAVSTAAARLESNQASAQLGASVSPAGDVNGDGFGDVIVGAPLFNAAETDEGAIFVFAGSALGIADAGPALAFARLESNQVGAQLGASAASADLNGYGYSDVIAGAPLFDAGEADEGVAWVALGAGSGIADASPAGAHAQLEADQAGAELGASVAGAGDVNGDGYSDVIVGAPLYDTGQLDAGAAFVFLGSPAGLSDANPQSAHARIESDQQGAQLGLSVASAGDVNGDGYSDVIVGAPLYDSGQPDEGLAFVWLGSPTGLADATPATAHARIESDDDGAQLGAAVASAGDVNGDGYSDVIAGAPLFQGGQPDEGAVFLLTGSATGLASGGPAAAAAQLESDQGGAQFGGSAAGAGDVNGDGYSDLIIGALFYDAGQDDEGAAFVFLGSAAGIASGGIEVASARLESDLATAQLGHAVAGAGDVNGDGYSDLIVGAYNYRDGQTNEGAAFVFLGSAAGIASASAVAAHAQLESDQAGAQLGFSVASAGDVNGDGYSDVVVGARFHDLPSSNEGIALVFLGGQGGIASGNPASAHALLQSDQVEARLGQSVAGAGDVNGDGFADLIAGALRFDAGSSNEGAALLFLGNSGRAGRAVVARQSDAAGARPLAALGASGSDGFRVHLLGSSGSGPSRVRLEVEACPPARPFGDAGCSRGLSPDWRLASGGDGAALEAVLAGLAPDTPYRWRARVLRAAMRGAIPPSPAAGPWRRLAAQAFEADVRTAAEPPDRDGDGFPDATDVCPYFAQAGQSDADGDGRGDACECGDQDGDGRNTVSDLVAINLAIFDPSRATPLCDGNGDGICNVSDIIAANAEIFSPNSSSTCERQPAPGP